MLKKLISDHEAHLEEQKANRAKAKRSESDSESLDIEPVSLSKADIELMIWEVDDDTDGFVSNKEFFNMYKRCISDEQNLEPRKLFNLVNFLMFAQPISDEEEEEKDGEMETKRLLISEEDTLEILFVRHGRDKLDEEIKEIFGEDKQNVEDEGEKKVSYPEFITKVNRRAMEARKRAKQQQKEKYTKKEDLD